MIMPRSFRIFLITLAVLMGCMAMAAAAPASKDVEFINGWYQSNDKRQCYRLEVIDDKTIRDSFYQLNNGNIKSTAYSEERPYYIKDGFVWLPEYKRKNSTVGEYGEAMKIPLGQSDKNPLVHINNPAELAKYYSKEKGYRLDLKYKYNRISAPPNANSVSTAKTADAKKTDANKPETNKSSSDAAKAANDTKSAQEAGEKSGGLGIAAIAGIVIAVVAGAGGLVWFLKGRTAPPPIQRGSYQGQVPHQGTVPPNNQPPAGNPPKFCPDCGTPVLSGSKFCGHCGKKL